MKKLLLFALVSVFPLMAHADDDDGDETVSAESVLLERALGATATTGPLSVRVHGAGHLDGRPYVIEIAEACADGARVIDTHSVCDVAPNTLAFSAERGEVSLLVRDASENASGCQANAKRVLFRLRSQCN